MYNHLLPSSFPLVPHVKFTLKALSILSCLWYSCLNIDFVCSGSRHISSLIEYQVKSITRIQTLERNVTYITNLRDRDSGQDLELVWQCNTSKDIRDEILLYDLEEDFLKKGTEHSIEQVRLHVIWEQLEKDLNLSYKGSDDLNYDYNIDFAGNPIDFCNDRTKDKYDDKWRVEYLRQWGYKNEEHALEIIDAEDKAEDYVICPLCVKIEQLNNLKSHIEMKHDDYLQKYNVTEDQIRISLPAEILTPQDLQANRWINVTEFLSGKTGIFVGSIYAVGAPHQMTTRAHLFCNYCLFDGDRNRDSDADTFKRFKTPVEIDGIHWYISLLEACPQCHRKGTLKIHHNQITVFDFTVADLDTGTTIEVKGSTELHLRKGDIVAVDGREEHSIVKGQTVKGLRARRVQILQRQGQGGQRNLLSGSGTVPIALTDDIPTKPYNALPTISIEEKFVQSAIVYCRQQPNQDIEYVKDLLPELFKNPDLKPLFKLINGKPNFTSGANKRLVKLFHLIINSRLDDGKIERIGRKPFKLRFVSK